MNPTDTSEKCLETLIKRLKRKGQRGSKPRCHLLTHGSPDVVTARLTALGAPFATVAASDRWMPQGFNDLEEAQLDKAPHLLPPALGARLREWWLGADRQKAMAPNFDIASTCKIDGASGLLLVEAKAHDTELTKAAAGKALAGGASSGRKASHVMIGAAIESARLALESATRFSWQISRDKHYQMSNRFAWAWKLADLGIPVVLVYLGFLNANEMRDLGEPFANAASWEALTRSQSAPLFPGEVWERRWSVNGVPLIPLIRSQETLLELETGS